MRNVDQPASLRSNPEDLIDPDLTDEERFVLRRGLGDWGGPARCTEELAMAMGFYGVQDLFDEGDRMRAAIAAGEPMSRFDWCRTLLATEIVFASNLVGSGSDWRSTAAMSDEETLPILRELQRKLTREVRPLIGNGLGTRHQWPSDQR